VQLSHLARVPAVATGVAEITTNALATRTGKGPIAASKRALKVTVWLALDVDYATAALANVSAVKAIAELLANESCAPTSALERAHATTAQDSAHAVVVSVETTAPVDSAQGETIL